MIDVVDIPTPMMLALRLRAVHVLTGLAIPDVDSRFLEYEFRYGGGKVREIEWQGEDNSYAWLRYHATSALLYGHMNRSPRARHARRVESSTRTYCQSRPYAADLLPAEAQSYYGWTFAVLWNPRKQAWTHARRACVTKDEPIDVPDLAVLAGREKQACTWLQEQLGMDAHQDALLSVLHWDPMTKALAKELMPTYSKERVLEMCQLGSYPLAPKW